MGATQLHRASTPGDPTPSPDLDRYLIHVRTHKHTGIYTYTQIKWNLNNNNNKLRVSKTALWERAPATKANDLSWMSGTHMVRRENNIPQAVL